MVKLLIPRYIELIHHVEEIHLNYEIYDKHKVFVCQSGPSLF